MELRFLMQTKITLRLEKELIQRAKSFAERTGKSVSQIVADYFASLGTTPPEKDIELTPVVRSLKGALRGTDARIEDYHRHLEDKYL
jgi:hypothetical protein